MWYILRVYVAAMAIVVACMCDAAAVAQADRDLIQRLRNEAPQRWADLDRFTSRVCGRCTVRYWLAEPGQTGRPAIIRRTEEILYRRNGNWALLHKKYRLVDEDGSLKRQYQGVGGVNSRYSFALFRETPEQEWRLSSVGSSNPTEVLNSYSMSMFVAPHLFRDEERFDDFFQRRDIQVTKAAWVNEGDRRLARITFRYRKKPGRSHVLYFDPSRYWILTKARSEGLNGGDVRYKEHLEFEEIDGFPVLTRAVLKTRERGWPAGRWYVVEAEHRDVRTADLPEYEFSVSAFGLPEIHPAIKQPVPMWQWLALIAVVAAIIAVLARWLMFRARPGNQR